MNLHLNRKVFGELIVGAANELAIPANIIEKRFTLLLYMCYNIFIMKRTHFMA